MTTNKKNVTLFKGFFQIPIFTLVILHSMWTIRSINNHSETKEVDDDVQDEGEKVTKENKDIWNVGTLRDMQMVMWAVLTCMLSLSGRDPVQRIATTSSALVRAEEVASNNRNATA